MLLIKLMTQTSTRQTLNTVNETLLTSVKACRKPEDLAEFSKLWKLNSTNTYTATSPKVIKNELVSMAPTLVLYMYPTKQACPAAGTCRQLCLNTAGNPAYLKGKLACRVRRNKAFLNDAGRFTRNLVLEAYRFYRKHANWDKLGLRLNGVSDWQWFKIAVTITQADSDYFLKAFNIYIQPKRYQSILEAILSGHDNYLEQNISQKMVCYDYTKRVDFVDSLEYINKINYHLSLSHGSKFDTLETAEKLGLNYLAAYKPIKGQPMPKLIKYRGKIYETFNAEKTDYRPLDKNDKTRIGLLPIKRTPNSTPELEEEFCLKFEIIA